MSKILIVEDEIAIAELEKDYLELSGFEVEVESQGDAGLVRALRDDFDLIILDLMLPGVDGLKSAVKFVKQKIHRSSLCLRKKMTSIRSEGLGWVQMII